MSRRLVLNIEDSSDDVLLLRSACRAAKASFRLEAVADGAQGIAYLKGEGEFAEREKFPLPDLVLLDLKLPMKSGFEVLEWIRAQPRLAKLPVVIFTASLHQGDMERAQELGADEFLIKKGGLKHLQELARAIEAALGQEPIWLNPITTFSAQGTKPVQPLGTWRNCTSYSPAPESL